MPLIDQVTLPESITNYLNGLDFPVKVVQGMYRQNIAAPSWDSADVDALGGNFTLDDLNERGVVLIDWGTASNPTQRNWGAFPGAYYTDGNERELRVREVLIPAEGDDLATKYSLTDDFVVAEVGPKTVWFTTTLRYLPNPELLALDALLGEPIRMARDSSRWADFEERQRIRNRRMFIEQLTEGVAERRVSGVRSDVQMNEAHLRELEQGLSQTLRELGDAKARLQVAEAGLRKSEEYWVRELEQIERHPTTKRVSVSGTSLTIYTNDLTLYDPRDDDRSVPLGQFEIIIDVENHRITLNNLTNRRRDRDHPHVTGGEACFGGHASQIMKFLADFEIGSLYEVLLSYLQGFNPDDDWGRYAAWWFSEEPATA